MENKYNIPLIGENFPQFKAQTTHGQINFPQDYKGSWIVLFSHPADFTPVCTTEFIAFNRRYKEFEKLNAKLVGLSIDQIFSHMKWTEWIKENLKEEIKFPIIADDRGNIADLLGMVHPSKGNNTIRAVFIIDPKGIMRAMLYYPQELGRNMDEILRMIEALSISDKNSVAMPANWPNNELIKDKVIIPPAQNEQDAKKRLKQYDCYDWWFCYKKL
jgi:peroxiredoxin (alkyl hydroperoxide reductase subunit C)